ncbi:hypothetical protein D5018_13920 [Parashewanella curva]|uniref:Uncharacterized protein n=1 Tax=Parashewanella curva TaxID=2338552 RepID=A0A3L8PWW2_9GAMM|nr:hypothetical protein [Parashewanella curva]RLV59103.1 hypothetical protein D5018_13920 [Parashewanella curva]
MSVITSGFQPYDLSKLTQQRLCQIACATSKEEAAAMGWLDKLVDYVFRGNTKYDAITQLFENIAYVTDGSDHYNATHLGPNIPRKINGFDKPGYLRDDQIRRLYMLQHCLHGETPLADAIRIEFTPTHRIQQQSIQAETPTSQNYIFSIWIGDQSQALLEIPDIQPLDSDFQLSDDYLYSLTCQLAYQAAKLIREQQAGRMTEDNLSTQLQKLTSKFYRTVGGQQSLQQLRVQQILNTVKLSDNTTLLQLCYRQ